MVVVRFLSSSGGCSGVFVAVVIAIAVVLGIRSLMVAVFVVGFFKSDGAAVLVLVAVLVVGFFQLVSKR